MISPLKEIEVASRARRSKAEDLIKSIRDIGHQINLKSSIPLIKNLRMDQTFKNEAKKKEVLRTQYYQYYGY